MAQFYSNPERETETYALPDVEVFYAEAGEWGYDIAGERVDADEAEGDEENGPHLNAAGYYWWTRLPGCLPDSEPFGPFETEEAALADAQDFGE